MKQALAERDEETSPLFSIECEEELPIRFTSGEEREINLEVRIKRKIVHNVELVLYVPPGFEIIDSTSREVPEGRDRLYPGSTRAIIFTRPRLPTFHSASLRPIIRASQKPGSYNFGYSFSSEELTINSYHSPEDEFSVEVVEASPVSSQLPAAQ